MRQNVANLADVNNSGERRKPCKTKKIKPPRTSNWAICNVATKQEHRFDFYAINSTLFNRQLLLGGSLGGRAEDDTYQRTGLLRRRRRKTQVGGRGRRRAQPKRWWEECVVEGAGASEGGGRRNRQGSGGGHRFHGWSVEGRGEGGIGRGREREREEGAEVKGSKKTGFRRRFQLSDSLLT